MRSGKILRGTIKKIADGESWTMPATIDDPAILDEIGSALMGKGWGPEALRLCITAMLNEGALVRAALK